MRWLVGLLERHATYVERVIICRPDKDLARCMNSRRPARSPESRHPRRVGVIEKFGVPPASIPDYLTLAGDSADGYPGLPGWGAKSTAAVLAKFAHLESIPKDSRDWHVDVANAGSLAVTLAREHYRALLFRTLATLCSDFALFDDVEELRWTGPDRQRAAGAVGQWRIQPAGCDDRGEVAATGVTKMEPPEPSESTSPSQPTRHK